MHVLGHKPPSARQWCPVCLFCISPSVPTRAQDMACCIASRCQRLEVHGKKEKRFQRKVFPDHQAIAEALGPSSLDEEERSGPGQCHGPEWGPKDGVPYPVAQYANSNTRVGKPGKKYIGVKEIGCKRWIGRSGVWGKPQSTWSSWVQPTVGQLMIVAMWGCWTSIVRSSNFSRKARILDIYEKPGF